MKNSISIEKINMQKTAAHVALSKGIIDSNSYQKRMKILDELEAVLYKEEQLKEQKLKALKNKMNIYATN
ncbi:hypothetical protein [Planococcus citreus]|uniref:Uncharacterized protein n=1 Tax=Planococcus citreus TaxID=1373 RepID=A0A497YG29_9BACL|nr:hypothetical protein [Planococcus citreus]RLJ89906.1 hypothetical protein DFR62_0046 [Planococcus citreus]